MKIENLNIFNQVNAKDQNTGSAARSSQEDQKSSQDSAFAKILSSADKKPAAKLTYDKRPVEKDSAKESSSERQDAKDTKDVNDSGDREQVGQSSAGDFNRKPIPDRGNINVSRSPAVGGSNADASKDEVRPEEMKKAGAPVEFDASGVQLNRRLAMQTFLRKMKEQLNVQPEQLMAAFGSLSMEELTRPPEMNLEKIVQGLNLSEQQKPVAKQLFEDMMKQTAADSMAEYLKSSGQQLSLQVVSQKEMQQKALDRSINQMNSNFFMAEQKPMLQNPVLAKPQLPNQNLAQDQIEAQGDDEGAFAVPSFMQATGKMSVATNMAAPNPANLAAAAQNVPANAEVAPAAEKSAETVSTKSAASAATAAKVETTPLAAGQAASPEMLSALMPQAKSSSASSLFADSESDEDLSADATEGNAVQTSSLDQQQMEKLKAALQAQLSNNDKSDGGKKEDMPQELNIQPQVGANKQSGFEKEMAPVGFNNKHVGPGQDSNNVKELISQAQFMIKKGGGEMKIRLSPDGLGEVAMKVNVRDGQVSVEMITETSDAKSLIEKGLGDLKATLASHKLNVDQIKVDLAHNTAKDFQQQHENASRHQAQQFMEEFRQDNQQWRQSFYDVPGAKAYKSQTRDEADNSYLTPQSTKKSGAASRRLDLVA